MTKERTFNSYWNDKGYNGRATFGIVQKDIVVHIGHTDGGCLCGGHAPSIRKMKGPIVISESQIRKNQAGVGSKTKLCGHCRNVAMKEL